MNLIEIITISVGISLNVFSVFVCFGAVLLKVEKSRLIKMLLMFCLWQSLAAVGGMLLVNIPLPANASRIVTPICAFVAIVIFVSLGILMIYKAKKNEPIFEHVQVVTYGQAAVAAIFTSIDAVFAGVAFGLMNTNMLEMSVTLLIVTAIFVIAGIYTGQRLGYEHKTQAYAIGGILLLFSACELIVRYMIPLA